MSLEIFLLGLLIVSTLTGLCTEALKAVFEERNVQYYANTLAGYVAAILSIAIAVGRAVITKTAFDAQFIVGLVALVFLSWLSAMVGYDKVIQAISQFKTYKKE